MALTDSYPTGDAGGLSIGDTRLIAAGDVVKSAAGAARTGILPAHTNALVTGTAGMAYSVAPFFGVASRTGTGVEKVANDAATSVSTTTAPGANSRIDVIWFRPQFVAATDAANVPLFGVTQGTAAASPVKPSIPTGAEELATATILSTTTQTSTAVITQTFKYTALEGGTVLFRNSTEQAAFIPHAGSESERLDTGVHYRSDGTTWWRTSYTQTVKANGIALTASTLTLVATLTLPADAPPGRYLVFPVTTTGAGAAGAHYQRVDWASVQLTDYTTDYMSAVAVGDTTKSDVITKTGHAGGAAAVELFVQVNAVSAACRLARITVLYVGP